MIKRGKYYNGGAGRNLPGATNPKRGDYLGVCKKTKENRRNIRCTAKNMMTVSCLMLLILLVCLVSVSWTLDELAEVPELMGIGVSNKGHLHPKHSEQWINRDYDFEAMAKDVWYDSVKVNSVEEELDGRERQDVLTSSPVVVVFGLPQSGSNLVRDYLSLCGLSIAGYAREDESKTTRSHEVDDALRISKEWDAVNEVVLGPRKIEGTDERGWLDRNTFRVRSASSSTTSARLTPAWLHYGFDASRANGDRPGVRANFRELAARMIERATSSGGGSSSNVAWVLADPDLHHSAPLWDAVLPRSRVCIHIVRSPTSFAESMFRFASKGRMSVGEWSHVWEVTLRRSHALCEGRRALYVNFDELARSPASTLRRLSQHLFEDERYLSHESIAHVEQHDRRTDRRVENLIRTSSLESSSSSSLLSGDDDDNAAFAERLYAGVVLASARDLFAKIAKRSGINTKRTAIGTCVAPKLHVVEWRSLPSNPRDAYATIVTGDAPTYVSGAIVSGISITAMDSSRDMIALVTSRVAEPSIRVMKYFGWKVWQIEDVKEAWFGRSVCQNRGRPLTDDQKVRWGRMFSKLRLWQLTEYQKVLYMDSDALVTGHAFEMFDLYRDVKLVGEGSVAKKSVVLAGVMMLAPSDRSFRALMERSKGDPPAIWHSTVDCSEQALINDYFGDDRVRFSLDKSTRESIGRPTIKREWTHDIPWIVHYLTKTCRKPWTRFVLGEVEYKKKLRRRVNICDSVPTGIWERRAKLIGLRAGKIPFTSLPADVAFEKSEEEDVLLSVIDSTKRRSQKTG